MSQKENENMAYQGRNTQSRGGSNFKKKAAPTTAAISDQVYFCSVKMGDDEFLNVGNIQKYKDSGKLTLSLNAEAVAKLAANDRGWINGIYVNESKEFPTK